MSSHVGENGKNDENGQPFPLRGRISMRRFSLTDLSNRSGEVVEAAFRGAVEITRRGRRKFVLLTAEDYDRLVTAADTRRAFHADDAPDEVAAMMLAALEDNDR
jgi:antitoxin Phd